MEGVIRSLSLSFKDHHELRKSYLTSPPNGGLLISINETVKSGELLLLRVRCGNDEPQVLRGVVLWRRDANGSGFQAGVGFLPSEVEKRERLLGAACRPAPYSAERREPRYSAALKVKYRATRTATEFVIDYTRNLSSGGLFVESRRMPVKGDAVLLLLYTPGDEEGIEIQGRVAWCLPARGFGVCFLKMVPDDRARLDKLVREISAQTVVPPAPAPLAEVISALPRRA